MVGRKPPCQRPCATLPNLADLPENEFLRKVFVNYSTLRHTVREAQARASLASATRANRLRPTRVVQEGDLIMYRDPRAQRAGGRYLRGRKAWRARPPWWKLRVIRVQVRTADGVAVRGIHLDDIVVIPPDDSTVCTSSRFSSSNTDPDAAHWHRHIPSPAVALPKRSLKRSLKYYQQLHRGSSHRV